MSEICDRKNLPLNSPDWARSSPIPLMPTLILAWQTTERLRLVKPGLEERTLSFCIFSVRIDCKRANQTIPRVLLKNHVRSSASAQPSQPRERISLFSMEHQARSRLP